MISEAIFLSTASAYKTKNSLENENFLLITFFNILKQETFANKLRSPVAVVAVVVVVVVTVVVVVVAVVVVVVVVVVAAVVVVVGSV